MMDMAKLHQENIIDMLVEANVTPAKVTYLFKDKSRMDFLLSVPSQVSTSGGEQSQAFMFAKDVESFHTFHTGFEITFKDGSKSSMTFMDE